LGRDFQVMELGKYKDKVLEINPNQRGSEKDENCSFGVYCVFARVWM